MLKAKFLTYNSCLHNFLNFPFCFSKLNYAKVRISVKGKSVVGTKLGFFYFKKVFQLLRSVRRLFSFHQLQIVRFRISLKRIGTYLHLLETFKRVGAFKRRTKPTILQPTQKAIPHQARYKKGNKVCILGFTLHKRNGILILDIKCFIRRLSLENIGKR